MFRFEHFWSQFLTVLSALSIVCSTSVSNAGDSKLAKSCKAMMSSTLSDGFVLQTPFDKKASWGQQVFSLRLDILSHMMAKVKDMAEVEKVEALDADDTRALFFQLQSLAAVYERYDSKFFKPLRSQFKAVEDAFGFKDLQASLAKKAKELNQPELEKYFESREKEGTTKLSVALKEWDEAGLERMRSHLAEYGKKWLTGKDDRKFLTEGLQKDALALAHDVKEMKFDDPEIERGLHELRRRVRWLVIEVLSLNHLVQYTDEIIMSAGEIDWFKEFADKNPKIMENKYMRVEEAVVKKGVRVPQHLHAILTQIVSSIGGMKDKAEMEIEFRKAMVALNYKAAQIAAVEKQLDENLKVQPIDHQELSRQYQHRITETNLLKDYAAQVNELNKKHEDEVESSP